MQAVASELYKKNGVLHFYYALKRHYQHNVGVESRNR
jgi:hypothetical protein